MRRRPPSGRRAAAWLTVAAAGLSLAACGSGDESNPRFCAVAEGSLSTQDPTIRQSYSTAFTADINWFARQPGDQPMCLILAVANPAANPIPTVPIHPEDPHSADADQEIEDNVAVAVAQFSVVLATARDLNGTPLVEALYALAARGDLRAGDTISVYSDMRQQSPQATTVNMVRINNPAAQAAAVNKALDRLASNGLLPDGKQERPSLRDVRVVAPVPSASVPVSDPDDKRQEGARQVVAQQFWDAWADRVGADLVWGKPADGGR